MQAPCLTLTDCLPLLCSPLPTQPATGQLGAAATTSPTCAAGSSTCTSVFSWTPNLQSTGAVICFQGSATSGGVSVYSPNQLCVTVNIGAIPTTTTAFGASGVCGGPTTLSARVVRSVE